MAEQADNICFDTWKEPLYLYKYSGNGGLMNKVVERIRRAIFQKRKKTKDTQILEHSEHKRE